MLEDAKNAKNARERRELIKSELRALLERGHLFITEMLLLEEPWRTYALEVADGVVVGPGGIPQPGGDIPLDLGQIRLLHVDDPRVDESGKRHGDITKPEMRDERIAGTSRFERVSRIANYGNDATLPHRTARLILFRDGWPFRNMFSNGRTEGVVVEWAWLDHKVRTDPDIDEATRALHARIKARLERAAPTAPPITPKSKVAAAAA